MFMADGSFGGLVTTEIMNWTGHVLSSPRSGLGELLKRPEASRTGIYILLGEDPDVLGGQMAYIGEADNIGNRLRAHVKEENKGGKDFWDRVVILTSKDSNLTKAHARYLESRFITLATQAGRAKLVNNTNPDPTPLPEADISDMEYYVTQSQIVLPALGVNLLRTKSADSDRKADGRNTDGTTPSSPLFCMQIPGGGVAYAQEIDGEFTVLKESEARSKWASTSNLKSGSHARKDHREALLASGILSRLDNGKLVFSDNYVFSSPSAAASVVVGTESKNGRVAWKVKDSDITYGEWQTRGI